MRMGMPHKGKKTVPFNISVPESLKEEMTGHREINWSAVATRAFERQLQAQKILLSFEEKGVTDEEAAERVLRQHRKR
jgi:hypothetical protein